jgi:hypothetical protein
MTDDKTPTDKPKPLWVTTVPIEGNFREVKKITFYSDGTVKEEKIPRPAPTLIPKILNKWKPLRP